MQKSAKAGSNSQDHRILQFFTVLSVTFIIICSGLSAQENSDSDLEYAVQILQMLCGLSSQDISAAYDISGDGKIGMEEAIKALRVAAGIHDKYEMRFGISGGMYPGIDTGEELIQFVTETLDQLGMVWLRHPGEDTAWFEVQPVSGQWKFEKLDAVINNNNHPWVIELYGDTGTIYPFGDFSGLMMESLTNPNEIASYAKEHAIDMNDAQQKADAELYVKTFVNRYKDSIKYWEIGNEGIGDSGRFDIVKNTYEWIKAEYPEAVVLLTALAGTNSGMFYSDLEALDSLLAQGIGEYFDVGNFHYYGNIEGEFEESLEKVFDDYKMILDKYGFEKPIWVTETSTSSHEDSMLSGASSEKIQARHVLKRLVTFSARGAEKVFWHDYRDTSSDSLFYQCNLIHPDVSVPKPAYYTFELVVAKIGYYKTVETLRRDDIKLYKFIMENGDSVYAAWSKASQVADFSMYIDKEDVFVTHIIEDDGIAFPETETVKANSVDLSESPIFIE